LQLPDYRRGHLDQSPPCCQPLLATAFETGQSAVWGRRGSPSVPHGGPYARDGRQRGQVRVVQLPISGRRPREENEARVKPARQQVKSERPAPRSGRSRFAACVRPFSTRGCVRGGLAGWARGEVSPSTWPTVAATSADCLSEHRTGSRVFLSLVQCSRGARTRTHERPRGLKRDSASARRESGGL